MYEEKSRETFIKIFNTKEALEWGKKEGCPKPICTIKGPKDHGINCVKWGKFDQTIFYATDKGRLLSYDIEEEQVVKARDVNRNEIFTIQITRDFTMLFTCSRDGSCKLLNIDTFDEVRSFDFSFPCRNAAISPLYEMEENQKFHVLLCGGQDAKDVTTTGA